jgi:hypothetical protein
MAKLSDDPILSVAEINDLIEFCRAEVLGSDPMPRRRKKDSSATCLTCRELL